MTLDKKPVFICIAQTQLLAKVPFKFQGASLWNELPKSIKDIKFLTKFKQALKLHLLNSL